MKKSTLLSLMAMWGTIAFGATAQEVSYMEEATITYPYGLYSSFAPSSVDVTWDNQAIKLIDPKTDDYGDDYVTALVQLGEGEKQEVKAYVMYSFGNPEDPEDEDIWNLDIALYELDDIFFFDGNTVTLILPEGIVENEKGEVNPAQDFTFYIVPTYTDYTVTPETGSKISGEDLTVKISFDDNEVEYLQSAVRAMVYQPSYKDIALEYGKAVTVNDDNELVIDLSSLESGEYEIVVPEGLLFVISDDEKYLSPDIWLEFTLDKTGGVVSITNITEKEHNVYDLRGIKVGNSIDGLGQGIYIVGGKKIVVRK